MKAETIIVHHFIKDYMIANELYHLIHLKKNNDLILSVKKARGRYQQELKEKSCKEKVVVCLMRSLLLQ